MSAIILQTTPTSGTYPEQHFGEVFICRLWVEFEDSNSNKWYGCFARQRNEGLDKVLVDSRNQTALVIACGQGYLVDIANKKLSHKTDEYPGIESAIFTTNPDYFISGTYHSIYVFDSEKLVKEITPNFTVDGIYFTGQQDKKAIGDLSSYVYEEFNVAFEFDLTTFEIIVKKEVKVRRFGLFEYVKLVDKDNEKIDTSNNLIGKIWKRITS